MSKKKMYGMLAFILFSFTVLAIVIIYEFNLYTSRTSNQLGSETELTSDIDGSKVVEGSEVAGDTVTPPEIQEPVENQDDNEVNGEESTLDPNMKEIKDVVMVFAGDIYMSNYIVNKYNSEKIDGILSSDLQTEFKDATIAMVNQEFTFSNGGTPMDNKQFTFRVDPKYVQIFQDMSLDIVTLANNHTLDYGITALQDSFQTLSNADIQYVGAGNNLEEAKVANYFDVNNKKVAILGASRVIPVPDWNAGREKPGMLTTYDPTYLLEEIKIAKEQSDYVVVYVHWGLEKKDKPEEYQRGLAKQYIDAGADIVIGSHPHVLQGIEYYNGKPIVYSLGNFMFYNSINQTAILKVTVNEMNETKVQVLPCKAVNAQTFLINDLTDKQNFYSYLTDISYDITFDESGFVMP
jgi:poly-gamma-glutamate synthesis protein (capsule biosynthesis protein)